MASDALQTVVGFALRAVGSPYVYGATGKPCTPAYRQELACQYPKSAALIKANCPVLSGRADKCINCRYFQKSCYDCAQLVRRAFEQVNINLPSGASSQWASPLWPAKGRITPEAFLQVCALFSEDRGNSRYPMRHVVLSLGDGRVVDARGHNYGVLLTKEDAYPWTHFALPEARTASDVPVDKEDFSTLRFGCRGRAVSRLQQKLIEQGFSLPRFGVDGIFGAETEGALSTFQLENALDVTGIAGSADQSLLFSENREVKG